MSKKAKQLKSKELTTLEAQHVSGGWWLRFLKPTKLATGTLPFGDMYGGQCKAGEAP